MSQVTSMNMSGWPIVRNGPRGVCALALTLSAQVELFPFCLVWLTNVTLTGVMSTVLPSSLRCYSVRELIPVGKQLV
jgi:hypothetical protein